METARLQKLFIEKAVPTLSVEFGYTNLLQVPTVEKVVVNIGLGEATRSANALQAAVADMQLITGQKPIYRKAKRSVSNFGLREGQVIGVSVTLRGRRMWEFLDRFLNIALPRVRDFRGISPRSFDGRGNCSIGISDQVVFPEIDYNKIDKIRGLQVVVVTTSETNTVGKRLLDILGFPFSDMNRKN